MGFKTSMDKESVDNNDILARTIEYNPLGLGLCAHVNWGGAGAYRISCSQIVLFVTGISDRTYPHIFVLYLLLLATCGYVLWLCTNTNNTVM